MSRKFGSTWAEYLYGLSLEMWQAEELGNTETFGWYAFFPAEKSILGIDSDGFVTAACYWSREECVKAWKGVRRDWSEFENEEDDVESDEYEEEYA